MSESVTLGHQVQARVAFEDPDGLPVDQSDVNLVVHKPDGTTDSVVAGDITHVPTSGVYTYLVTLDQVGVWQTEWRVGTVSDDIEDILVVEPRLIGTFSETTMPALCGAWFDVTSEQGAPCCTEHYTLSLRPGCPAPNPLEDDCAEPSVEQLALLTSSMLSAMWGPAWPGWLCGSARVDLTPSCLADVWPRPYWRSSPRWCGPPHTLELPLDRFTAVNIAVTIDGDRVPNADLVLRGANRIGYGPGVWPAGVIEATYRYGGVPMGAWLPWRRLYCGLRRLHRPAERLATNVPTMLHVRSVNTSGASLDYSEEEIKQGLLGWDPIVSNFVAAGVAQLEQSRASMNGSWAPITTAGVVRMEPSFSNLLAEET